MIHRTHAAGHKDCSEKCIRIGAVSYLNSKPLIEGLAEKCDGAELVLDYPSRLADDLGRGQLDVALIPSVEAFSDPDYEVISDACVATHGPVFSVKLFSRVHPGEIRTLALDDGSRTSAALTRVMLDERFGVQPQLRKLPLGANMDDSNADAVLVIGDRAMLPPVSKFHTVWDLGEEWVRWTGLPFVFAMWVTRKGAVPDELADRLAAARDIGLQSLAQIARRECEALHLTEQAALDYLEHNLHFVLGSAEQAGLRLFQELAAQHGLAGETPVSIRVSENSSPRSVLTGEKVTQEVTASR